MTTVLWCCRKTWKRPDPIEPIGISNEISLVPVHSRPAIRPLFIVPPDKQVQSLITHQQTRINWETTSNADWPLGIRSCNPRTE